MTSQLETTFTEEVRAKATAYLEELWQDYKIAARAYRKLFDMEVDRIDYARTEAGHKTCLERYEKFEDAKRAYQVIGLINLIPDETEEN